MTTCVFVGRSTLDLVYAAQEYPEQNTKIFAAEFLVQAGGPALNAAITFSLLGGSATLFSAVGKQGLSSLIREELLRHDVQLRDVARAGFSPPVSSVVVNLQNGSRTIINAPFTSTQMGEVEEQNRPEASLVLVDGFLLTEFGDLISHYSRAGASICLDGGSWKPSLAGFLERFSVAICSERFLPPGTGGALSVIDYLHGHGIDQVAITRGGNSILASDKGRKFEVSIENTKAVDTLGAGDVLHGAFCWYSGQGLGFEDALRHASQIATRKCETFGARAWAQVSHYVRGDDAG